MSCNVRSIENSCTKSFGRYMAVKLFTASASLYMGDNPTERSNAFNQTFIIFLVVRHRLNLNFLHFGDGPIQADRRQSFFRLFVSVDHFPQHSVSVLDCCCRYFYFYFGPAN